MTTTFDFRVACGICRDEDGEATIKHPFGTTCPFLPPCPSCRSVLTVELDDGRDMGPGWLDCLDCHRVWQSDEYKCPECHDIDPQRGWLVEFYEEPGAGHVWKCLGCGEVNC